MAKLRKQILGEVSGTLGTFVFRGIKGKNVIGVRPSSVNVPNDQTSIDRRSKFRMSSKLAKAILADPYLKKLWKEVTPYEQNAQNYILQQNYNSVQPQTLSDVIKIVPEFGFPLNVSSVNKSAAQLSATIGALDTNAGFKILSETKILMSSVLFLSNPVDTSVADYSFLSASSAPQTLNTTAPITLDALLDGSAGMMYDKYQEHKLFFVIITLNEENLLVQHSSTYVG